MGSTTSSRPVPRGLEPFWNGTVAELATLPDRVIEDGQKERHRMYSLLLMSILSSQWNGNRHGEIGDYGPWRTSQEAGTTAGGDKAYRGGTYLGHNISALAVDGEGRVIDYEFNHNNLFDSSVEHAESRLVRRVFALNQVYAPWASAAGALSPPQALRLRQQRQLFATAVSERPEAAARAHVTQPARGYSTLLKDVTLYTSLESCAQCSGIMCLASVKEVVYLQWDQGEFLIGNIMYQATTHGSGFTSPRPVPADSFDLEYFAQLNDANDAFAAAVATEPFYRRGTFEVRTPSVSSFLCTDAAFDIYATATAELASWTAVAHPAYVPGGAPASSLTNEQVLVEVKDFLAYTREINNRGTPHRI